MTETGKAETTPAVTRAGRWRTGLILSGILLITLLAYWPALHNGFVNLDDDLYITAMPQLSWQSVARVCTTTFEGHYHPLTLLCLGLEHHFFGTNPFPYHWLGVLLHLLNTLLVFFLIFRLTKRTGMSLLACAVFGMHPVHVEAVAWIPSRKDLLYSAFYLLSLLCYAKYALRNRPGSYTGALFFFVLSLMSKAMAVALAPSLLLIDYFLGRRLLSARIWIEKIPFFILALLGGWLAIEAQKSTGYITAADAMQPLYLRFLDACYGALLYARNLVLPDSLCAHYPYPALTEYNLSILYTGVVAGVLLLAVLLIAAMRRSRLIAFSLLFMAVNLILMLKLVPVSDFIAADRYAYVASIGFCLMAAAAVVRLIELQPNRKMPAMLLFGGYLLTLAVATNAQSRLWNNSLVLWDNVVSHYPRDIFALDMRGNAKVMLADFAGAIADYDRALKQDPAYVRSCVNRGYALSKQGKLVEAIADYERAIMLDPASFLAFNNISVARYELQDYSGAAVAASRAITLTREPVQIGLAYHNRGRAEAALGNSKKALDDFGQSLALNPGYYPAWTCRASEKIKRGDYNGALEDIRQAIRIDPADPLAPSLETEAQRHVNDEIRTPAAILDAPLKDPVPGKVPGRP